MSYIKVRSTRIKWPLIDNTCKTSASAKVDHKLRVVFIEDVLKRARGGGLSPACMKEGNRDSLSIA